MSLGINAFSVSSLLSGSLASSFAAASPLAGPLSSGGGSSARGLTAPPGSSVGDTIGLAVASLDLALVTSLINAIDIADITSAAEAGTTSGIPQQSLPPAIVPSCCSTSVVEPREHIRLAPYFEPRPIFYYSVAPPWGSCRSWAEDVKVESIGPPRVPECELPFQPPWKVLPWQTPPPVIQKIKVVGHRPDEAQKGSMIDVLI